MQSETEQKLLGILGGLGPMASVYFCEMLISHTKAECDADHINFLLSSRADTPDRSSYILGLSKEDPTSAMTEEAVRLERAGADLILCQHSHCLGCYEEYEGGHILYGQGNSHFVSPKNKHATWHDSMGVFYDTVNNTVEFVPITGTENGITLTKGEKKDAVVKAFEERNASLKDGTWREHWHEFCESKRHFYMDLVVGPCYGENATEDDNETFNHCIRCEAHLDILHELCPTWYFTKN